MNREIKFRVWDREYNNWIKDNYSGITSSGELLTYRASGMVGGWILEFEPEKRFIIQWFTGMLDRYGIEIYENDLVGLELAANINSNKQGVGLYEVVYEQGGFILKEIKPNWVLKIYTTNHLGDFNTCVVKGNRFETPELLETSK